MLLVFGAGLALSSHAGGARQAEGPQEMVTIDGGEYEFRAHVVGDAGGTPVILLHGFPETSFMWRGLQELLGANGYYTVAFDQRGYSPGARPRGRRNYRLELVSEDVIAVADSLGLDRFHLIGHDWGSAAGWAVAARFPDRVISWTALSVPHVDAFARAIRNDPAQHEASSYMRAFQIPVLPELLLRARDYRRLKAIWEHSSPEEIEAYLSVFNQRGALSSALNWYRANYRLLTDEARILPDVIVPTLFVWGRKDPAILRAGVDLNSEYVAGEYVEHCIDAGHWLMQESFPEVSVLILEHLGRHRD
jgi:pimeloyl-ACP methyl ester carboxylesterase